jgi:hypothetical protein
MDPQLILALSAAGIVDKNNGGDWTINNVWIGGTLTLDTYTAWANTHPPVHKDQYQQSFEIAGPAMPNGGGGAAITMVYSPANLVPLGATPSLTGAVEPLAAPTPGTVSTIHWLQYLETNFAIPNSPIYLPGNIYLDNVGAPAGNRFYDAIPGAYANSTTFVDQPCVPTRIYDTKPYETFHTRLATWDPANKIINISYYETVWGYSMGY